MPDQDEDPGWRQAEVHDARRQAEVDDPRMPLRAAFMFARSPWECAMCSGVRSIGPRPAVRRRKGPFERCIERLGVHDEKSDPWEAL